MNLFEFEADPERVFKALDNDASRSRVKTAWLKRREAKAAARALRAAADEMYGYGQGGSREFLRKKADEIEGST